MNGWMGGYPFHDAPVISCELWISALSAPHICTTYCTLWAEYHRIKLLLSMLWSQPHPNPQDTTLRHWLPWQSPLFWFTFHVCVGHWDHADLGWGKSSLQAINSENESFTVYRVMVNPNPCLEQTPMIRPQSMTDENAECERGQSAQLRKRLFHVLNSQHSTVRTACDSVQYV